MLKVVEANAILIGHRVKNPNHPARNFFPSLGVDLAALQLLTNTDVGERFQIAIALQRLGRLSVINQRQKFVRFFFDSPIARANLRVMSDERLRSPSIINFK